MDAVRKEDLTRNPEEVENYDQDSLIEKGKLCTRTGIKISETFDTLHKIQSSVECPILIFHGTADKVTEISESLAFFHHIKTPNDKKLFVKIPGFYHELYNEPEREPLVDMVVDFCKSGGTKFPQGNIEARNIIGEDRVMELDLIKK